ncbi:hypothetical protein TDB9533_04489 [Thalassocella blandensis]|nr:hypothetical protein TDB9533_04489 [Thalassocella blandensis]
MIKNWRKIIVALLLTFTFSQLVHAYHSVEISEKGKASSEHLACYICQSHSASAVNSHAFELLWQACIALPFQFSVQCNSAAGFIEYQRLLRAPPHLS